MDLERRLVDEPRLGSASEHPLALLLTQRARLPGVTPASLWFADTATTLRATRIDPAAVNTKGTARRRQGHDRRALIENRTHESFSLFACWSRRENFFCRSIQPSAISSLRASCAF